MSQQITHEWSFDAIGTRWSISLYQPVEPSRLHKIKQLIAERVETFDVTYSRFRTDSLVTAISKQAGDYIFPPDAGELFSLYRQLYEATDGLVTPLVGQLLSDAGYDADYSLRLGTVRPVPEWDDVMRFENGVLHTTQPILLDVGAAGKGYLVDRLTDLLGKQGITEFCVDGSGDMRCQGLAEPLTIGLENPDDTSQVIGVLQLHNQAVCASAPGRRSWPGYHHIMNPRTLSSTKGVKAVWVTADSCALADGLTTALFFVEPKRLHQFQFEHAILMDDNTVATSAGFKAELFTS